MRRTIITTAVVSLLLLAVGAASASAEETAAPPAPWWGITTGSRPTDLQTDVAQDEVQRLTVSATGGSCLGKGIEEGVAEYGCLVLVRLEPGHVAEEAYVKFDSTANEMQQHFEGLYGAGNVKVTGGPGDETGSKPYEITFIGQLADQHIEPVEAIPYGLTLPGGEGSANVAEVTPGQVAGKLVVEAQNLGDAAVQGCSAVPAGQGKYTEAECKAPAGSAAEGVFEKTPATITDTLPEGLRAVAAEGVAGERRDEQPGVVSCTIGTSGKEVTCTFGETPVPECGRIEHPACTPTLRPFEQIEVLISVVIGENAKTGEVNTATVSGGGASGVRTATHGVEVNGSERFGIETYLQVPEQFGGAVDTQAGSHPFQLTTVINANTKYDNPLRPAPGNPRTVALVKDNVAELPAGLVGNPTPFEQCTDAQFVDNFDTTQNENKNRETFSVNECPPSSAVGVALVHYTVIGAFGGMSETSTREPIFNMVPLTGEPARFAFNVGGAVPVFLNASVRTGGDYGVTVSSHSIIQVSWLTAVKLTFWGVPGSPLHDKQRGFECLFGYGACGASTSSSPPPFLTMPTLCGAFRSTLLADSWPYEGRPSLVAKPATYELEENGHPLSVDGCNHLPFTPSIEVKPDVPNASTSTGLDVKLQLPQTAELNPEGLAESSLRDTTVTLPAGVAVNPSGANDLEACSANPGDLPAGRLGSPGDQIGKAGESGTGDLCRRLANRPQRQRGSSKKTPADVEYRCFRRDHNRACIAAAGIAARASWIG